MAQDNHVVTINENPEVLEVIREEQCSPVLSSANLGNIITESKIQESAKPCKDTCSCEDELVQQLANKIGPNEMRQLIKEKEDELEEKFKQQLQKEIAILKDRFDFILQNEQVRASYMMREAHRERQEKITALQTQLECKNLSGLMYVMCSERRKSKLEKLRLIEEYTRYINVLQDILGKSQQLILHLSRGYKTAARVDDEWRQKMKRIVQEFQAFIYHYAGGTPESNQYFFDLPSLLKTEAPIVDDPEEDPCDCEEEQEINAQDALKEERPWWEEIEGDSRPFLMFGDMADFKPPQRRAVLKVVKAAKTAPRKWKNYVFNELSIKAGCSNLNSIKDEYSKHLPIPQKWECHAAQTENETSKASLNSPGTTTQSIDARGHMGSILKIITTNGTIQVPPKTALLGARDSMEIASTTRLREKVKRSNHSKVVINVGSRRASLLTDVSDESVEEEPIERKSRTQKPSQIMEEEDVAETLSPLGSLHNDSLEVIQGHVPDQDHRINYEKVCPMEKCQRMQVDSFVRTLPPYMRASPFMHFEQTYDDYETCSPEQLEILKTRIADKKKKEIGELNNLEESPLSEWTPSVEGIAVQTSDISVSLPPCTCRAPMPSPASSNIRIFNVEDLIPVKETLDEIIEECFYDNRVEFNRFTVIGQERPKQDNLMNAKNFTNTRLQEITKILKTHPSLLEIFQANLR